MNKKRQDINKFHPILSRQRCRYHHLSGETPCLAVQMATLPMVWFRIIDPTLNDGYSDGQERMIVALRHSSLIREATSQEPGGKSVFTRVETK